MDFVHVHSKQGGREYQEDTYSYGIFPNCQIYGVYDGHSGSAVSKMLAESLPVYISNKLQTIDIRNSTIVKNAIMQAFLEMDEYIYSEFGHEDSGSTAVMAIVVNDTIYFCNLGDSRGLAIKRSRLILETKDHKPNDPEEKERILRAGGYVKYSDTWRVDGELAVARAFGDMGYKLDSNNQYMAENSKVSPLPTISTVKVNQVDYVVLASDGFFDVMTSEYTARNLEPISPSIAEELTQEAYNDGSQDNITVMVIDFRQ